MKKKLVSLLLAMVMATQMVSPAMAATETIPQPESQTGNVEITDSQQSSSVPTTEKEKDTAPAAPVLYTVTAEGATAEPAQAAEGTKVVLTAKVPEGQAFDKWEATEGVEIIDGSFAMPAQDVQVKAVFKAIESVAEAPKPAAALEAPAAALAVSAEPTNMLIDYNLVSNVLGNDGSIRDNCKAPCAFNGVYNETGWYPDTFLAVFQTDESISLSGMKIFWDGDAANIVTEVSLQKYSGRNTTNPSGDLKTEEAWTKISSLSGDQISGKTSEMTFNPDTTHAYRIVITKSDNNKQVTVPEIELYGTVQGGATITTKNSIGSAAERSVITKSGNFILPQNSYTTDDPSKIFSGWSISGNSTEAGQTLMPGTNIKITGDIIITAQWATNVAYKLTKEAGQVYSTSDTTDPNYLFNGRYEGQNNDYTGLQMENGEWVAFVLNNPAVVSQLRLYSRGAATYIPTGFSFQTLNDEAAFATAEVEQRAQAFLNDDTNWHDVLTVTGDSPDLTNKSYVVPSVENSKVYRLILKGSNTAQIGELQLIQREAPQNPVKVTFDPGTGTGTAYTVDWEQTSSLTIPYCRFNKDRCDFAGWKIEGDTSSTLYHPDSAKGTASYQLTTDPVTFVAQWVQAEYIQVTVNENNNTETRTIDVKMGSTFKLPEIPSTRPDGKWFTHWEVKTGSASSGESKQPGESITVNEATTITAQWSEPQLITGGGTLTSGAYKTQNVELNNTSITIGQIGQSSNVVLFLTEGTTFKIGKGNVILHNGSCLTIEGTGTLELDAGTEPNAALAPEAGETGTIIINGGNLVLKDNLDKNYAGCNAALGSATSTVQINGGHITIDGTSSNSEKYSIGGNVSIGGNAVITTSQPIQGSSNNWSGIVSQDGGKNTQVYGNPSLGADYTVEVGNTLTIGSTLTVPQGVTLTNKGTIESYGTIKGDGTFKTVAETAAAVSIVGPAENPVYTGNAVTADQFKLQRKICGKNFDVIGWTASFTKADTTVPDGWPAGEDYKIVYTKDGATNITKGQTFTIAPATITGEIKQKVALTYNGSEQTATVANTLKSVNSRDITVSYGKQSGTYDLTAVPTFTDAGTYNVYYKATAPNHNAMTGSFEVTIDKASPAAPDAPTRASRTETSITLNAVTTGVPAYTHTVEYSKDGRTWQDGLTFDGLTAGTEYTFYARIKATNNNNASANSTGLKAKTLKTAPAASVVTINYAGETITFDDSQYEVSKNAEFTQALTTGASITDMIGKTIYVRHKGGESAATAVAIPARPENIEAPVIDYTAETLTVDASGMYKIGGDEFAQGSSAISITSKIPAAGAGAATVTYYKAATDSAFKSAEATMQIPARPATPAAPAATDANIKDTSITLTAVAGAEYQKASEGWGSETEFTGLTANTPYTFKQRIKATGSAFASAESTAAITTKKTSIADAVVTVSGSYTYDGTAKVPTNIKVELNGTVIPSTQYDVAVTNNTNAGDNTAVVTVTAMGDGNYSGQAVGHFSIAKANYDMTGVTFENATKTYNGQPQSLTISGELPTGADGKKVTVSYSEKKATNVSDGTVTVTATFATTSTNYNVPEAKTATITIEAKDISGAVVTLGDPLKYTGETLTQNVQSVTVDGLAATYTVKNNTGKDVDTYNMTITGNGNFKGSVTKEFAIAKHDALALTAEMNLVRNVANFEQILTLTGVTDYPADAGTGPALALGTQNLEANTTATLTGDVLKLVANNTTAKNAGSVVINLTGMKNYADSTITVTVKYTDKTPVTAISGITVTGAGKTYDGKAVAYTGTPTAKVGDQVVQPSGYTYTWQKADGTVLDAAPVNAGSYKLVVAVKADDTQYIGSVTIEFSIEKAVVTIAAENKSAHIGSTQPTNTYKVSGLVGEDKLAGSVTFTDNAANMNTAGNYSITPAGGNAGENYTIQYKAGTLTVEDHSWKTEWSKNGTNHWHECSVCHAHKDEAAHTWNAPEFIFAADGKSATAKTSCACGQTHEEAAVVSSEITTAATCTVMGTTTYTAKVTLNGTEYTETTTRQDVATIAHNYVGWTKDGNNHWHECTMCHQKADSAAHTYGDWTIIHRPTTAAEGSKKHVCTVCGHEEIVAIPKKEELPEPVIPNAPANTDFKLESEEGISQVPSDVKAKHPELNTPEKIETKMQTVITEQHKEIPAAQTKVFDVELMQKTGDGAWQKVTPGNFPTGGLTVTIPYPSGTGMNSHDFVVVHMIIHGASAGTTEMPAVTKTASGIQFKVTSLSPISVGWKEVPPAPETKPEAKPAPTDKPESFDWQSVRAAIAAAKAGAKVEANVESEIAVPHYIWQAFYGKNVTVTLVRGTDRYVFNGLDLERSGFDPDNGHNLTDLTAYIGRTYGSNVPAEDTDVDVEEPEDSKDTEDTKDKAETEDKTEETVKPESTPEPTEEPEATSQPQESVEEAETKPGTTHTALWVILALAVAALAISGIVIVKKKKQQ